MSLPLVAMLPPAKPIALSTFLGLVLPADGNHLILLRRHGNGMKQEGFHCVEKMGARISDLDAAGIEVWHACASYVHAPDEQRPDGSGMWGRKRDNVAALCAFFLDIDVDAAKPNKAYANLDDAWDALVEFEKAFGLPANYVVSSGGGLHVYWLIEEDLRREAWEPIALKFKNATALAGLKVDQCRTSDAASVLRPVGTLNRKPAYGANGIRVTGQWRRFGRVPVRMFEAACASISARLIVGDEGTPDRSNATQLTLTSAGLSEAATETYYWFDRLENQQKPGVLRSLLRTLPVCRVADNPSWIKAGAALKGINGVPQDELFGLFRTWSQSTEEGANSWAQVDESAQRRRWDSFEKSGVGALIAMARDAAWTPAALHSEEGGDSLFAAVRQAQLANGTRWTKDEAIAKVSANVVFVTAANKYLLEGRLMVREALDTALSQRMPMGDRGPIAASSVFKGSSGEVVHSLGYMPGSGRIYIDTVNNQKMFNRWDGYLPTLVRPTVDEKAIWLAAMRHIGNGDKETIAGIVRFSRALAYLLRNPGSRVGRAFLFIGVHQGSGKSTLTTAIPQALFGNNNVRIVSDSELHSEFNSYAANARIIVLPELRQGNRKDALRQNDRLKTLITDEAVTVIAKGCDGFNVQNVTTVFASSNYPNAAAIDGNDRRWDVIETGARLMPVEIAAPLYKMIKQRPGALAYIYYHAFYTREFQPNAPAPKTHAKDRMAAAGRAGWLEKLHDAYEANSYPLEGDCVAVPDLRVWLTTECERGPSEQAIRLELQNMAPDAKRIRARKGSLQTWVWVIRNVVQWEQAGPAALYDHYVEHKRRKGS